MRPRHRTLVRLRRRVVAPGRARLTARAAIAHLGHGREALGEIEQQLDALLRGLRGAEPAIDARAPDRLAGSVERAGRALSVLGDLRRLLPQRP